jgi:biotin transport system substrate-specific component
MKQNDITWTDVLSGNERIPHPPIALVLWPSGGWVRDVILVIAGSLFVALLAQVSIPLPFTVVPITGQTLGVALTAAALGGKRGALALLTYLGEGAVGLPFFAGGAGGWGKIAGPTGGYLIGFVIAAFVVGSLCERGWDRSIPRAALAFLIGDALVFLVGVPWLALSLGLSLTNALATGLMPFIPGDLIKISLATLVVTGCWQAIERRKKP